MAANGKAPGAGADGGSVGPDRIRNVVLVGHASAGKTTVAEALLLATGAITRSGRVEDGSTVCDHEDVEHRLGRSVSCTVAATMHEGVRINLVDTTGHADFVGEVRAGLRAADAAPLRHLGRGRRGRRHPDALGRVRRGRACRGRSW